MLTSSNINPSITNTQVALYLDQDSDLIVKRKVNNNDVTHNITGPFTGQANALPFYDKNGVWSDQSSLFFKEETTQKTFQIGNNQLFTQFLIENKIPSNVTTTTNTAEITMILPELNNNDIKEKTLQFSVFVRAHGAPFRPQAWRVPAAVSIVPVRYQSPIARTGTRVHHR